MAGYGAPWRVARVSSTARLSRPTITRRPMTQIRTFAQPVPRRPGALGVHSLDSVNVSVPDMDRARRFYGSFGLDLKEEANRLGIYAHGHPHRWASIVEGPRKKF